MAGDRAESGMDRARALVALGRHTEALEILGGVLASAPDEAATHCLAAQCLLALERPGEALAHATEARAREPDLAWAHRLVAIALHRSAGSPWLEREAARQAVRLAPLDVNSFVVAADAELRVRDLPAAWAAANEAVRVAPESVSAHVAVGLVALEWPNYPIAERAFRHAVALDPASYAAMNNLGAALVRQRRLLAGLRAYGHAIPLQPAERVAKSNVRKALRPIVARVVMVALLLLVFVPGIAVSIARTWGPAGLAVASLGLVALVGAGGVIVGRRLPSAVGVVIREAVLDPVRTLWAAPSRALEKVRRRGGDRPTGR